MTDRPPPLPSVQDVEHRFVTANGIRIHVAEAGQGPPLMLLHSGPQHWYASRHVIPQLAPHFRLICPDLRGFGWSDVPRRATTGGSGTWPMTVLTTLLLAPGAN